MSMTSSEDPPIELSVVVPMRNESLSVPELFDTLLPVLQDTGKSYEILCINDGSTDDTLALLLARQKDEPVIKIVDLSRGFGKEAALTSGIDHAQGAAVIIMDADLQHPPDVIPDLIAKWEEGYEVVYGARRSRIKDGWLKRLTSQGFYAVFNRLSDTKLPPDAGDFRLMDRVVVDVLRRLGEHSRFMKGMFAWVGFKQVGVPFECPERQAGESQWSYFKLLRFALDGIFSFSSAPLRLWTWIGATTAFFALVYAFFLVLRVFIYGRDVPGYASIIVAILFFGGVQLISVGVLGEYIGRIFRETKGRPIYIVKRTYGLDDPKAFPDASPEPGD